MKPPDRSGHPLSVPPNGWQAGIISLEICRVRDKQGDWGGHFEGQTVP
jgi:hypothetical protein